MRPGFASIRIVCQAAADGSSRMLERFHDQVCALMATAIGLFHRHRVPQLRDDSLHNPTKMKREPIWRLGGPHAIADRVEVVVEITKL